MDIIKKSTKTITKSLGLTGSPSGGSTPKGTKPTKTVSLSRRGPAGRGNRKKTLKGRSWIGF